MSFANSSLNIKVKTWVKDSHGLYDYEARDYVSQTFDVYNSSALLRNGSQMSCVRVIDHVQYRHSKDIVPSQEGIMALVTECSDGIRISCDAAKTENNSNQFWYSVDEKDEKHSKGYPLKAGDVIKIGKMIIKVRQIKTTEEPDVSQRYQNTILQAISRHVEESRCTGYSSTKTKNGVSNTAICKICLSDQKEEDDFFISPCNCDGSMKYVHYKCLQKWIRSKLNVKSAHLINFNWAKLTCELCKTPLPLVIKHEGKELMIMPCSEKVAESYALLEVFSKENSSNGVYLIGLSSNEKFRIGRGEECEVQIKDISVSRVHAFLSIFKGKLHLADNSSRYGTLVLMKKPIVLNNSFKKYSVQCGRSLITFSYQTPWLSFLSCFSSVCGQSNADSPKIPELKRELEDDTKIEEELSSDAETIKNKVLKE